MPTEAVLNVRVGDLPEFRQFVSDLEQIAQDFADESPALRDRLVAAVDRFKDATAPEEEAHA